MPMIAALLLALASQDPAPAGTPEPADALARAVAAQRVGERAPAVEHFGLDLNLRERGETPREVDVTVLFTLTQGGRLQLILDDSERGGVRVEKGFDGDRYWLKEQDREPVVLSGREYAQDREAIDETLDLCEELLLLFDLDRLQQQTRDLEITAGTLVRRDASQPHWILTGAILLHDEPRRFGLWLDQETWLPSRLTLESPAVEETPLDPLQAPDQEGAAPRKVRQEFDLGAYHDFPLLGSEEPQGRLLPRMVREYRRDENGARHAVRWLELHNVQWRLAPRIRRLPG